MPRRKRPKDPARQKVERFEGWWHAASASPYPSVGGKIEWDGFASGDSEIELFAIIPDLPDGSDLIVMWGDVEIMTANVRGGVAKRDLETKDGDRVPRLANEQVELRHEGVVIAYARLEPD
jgi:hypothetical protein